MSCYFRHLKDILSEAGIEVTSGNRKQVDQAIHGIVAVAYKDCPVTWKRLKLEMLADEQQRRDLVTRLQKAVR